MAAAPEEDGCQSPIAGLVAVRRIALPHQKDCDSACSAPFPFRPVPNSPEQPCVSAFNTGYGSNM